MFKHLFSQLKDLHNRTRLLEACGWSESRADELILTAQTIISDATEKISEQSTIQDLKKEIIEHLIEKFSEEEIDVILSLVEEMSDSPEKVMETMKYEC